MSEYASLKEWPGISSPSTEHRSRPQPSINLHAPLHPSYNLYVQLFWYRYFLFVVVDLWCSAVAGIGEFLVDEDCCEGGL